MLRFLNNTKVGNKGFTLVELMIVVAIIGILAAIAVPQFMSYRLRAYNTGAKAVDHNLKADNANLNAELGIYGHTQAAAATLAAVTAVAAVADASAVAGLETAATATVAGARLVGTTTSLPVRSMAVPISLGRNGIAHVIDFNNANDDSTYHAYARNFKGDTCYAIDEELENVLYSVSNPVWRNAAGLGATTIAPAIAGGDVHDGIAGGGALISPRWTIVR